MKAGTRPLMWTSRTMDLTRENRLAHAVLQLRAMALGLGGMFAAMMPAATAYAGDDTMRFDAACKAGTRIHVAAVGDLLFHKQLLAQAFRKGGNFAQFWEPVASVLRDADLAYGNLEGPAAAGLAAGGRRVRDPGRRIDYVVYGYRLPNLSFNYHPSVVDDLKASGFDVISTVNNHAFDRGIRGVDATIEKFDEAGLPFTGTRHSTALARPWHVVTEAKGINVAWLACSYSTNGIPDPKRQALLCYRDRDELLSQVRTLAADKSIDAVIVTPHWGWEDKQFVNPNQRQLGRELIDAGAQAVIGTHAHMVQPWERHVTPDGRDGLIIYSTGNFISNQRQLPQRAGMIALLEFIKEAGGKARIAAAGYIPTWVSITSVHRVHEMGPQQRSQLRAMKRYVPDGNQTGMAAFLETRRLSTSCAETESVATAKAD